MDERFAKELRKAKELYKDHHLVMPAEKRTVLLPVLDSEKRIDFINHMTMTRNLRNYKQRIAGDKSLSTTVANISHSAITVTIG